MMAKKDKTNEKAKRPFHKGGMPPFVPTEEDRAIVKLLVSMGMAQHRVCLRIRGRDGKPIAETTLKKYFAHELMVGKVEVVTKVLTEFMQAIGQLKRANNGAIERYIDQRMWRPESGGWRARSYEAGGAQSAASGGSDLPPVQLIVQFVKPNPSKRPPCAA